MGIAIPFLQQRNSSIVTNVRCQVYEVFYQIFSFNINEFYHVCLPPNLISDFSLYYLFNLFNTDIPKYRH